MLDTRQRAYEDRLPQTRASLQMADVETMVSQKLEFDAALNQIELERDWLALATDREHSLWQEISELESQPVISSGSPEADEPRQKIRLMKGQLQWTLDKAFNERLWLVRRELKNTGEALVETQRARRQIHGALLDEPARFEEFTVRVDGISPRIEQLRGQIRAAKSEQQQFLRNMAIGELYAQKERLNTYTTQARFALASMYDRSTKVSEVAE